MLKGKPVGGIGFGLVAGGALDGIAQHGWVQAAAMVGAGTALFVCALFGIERVPDA